MKGKVGVAVTIAVECLGCCHDFSRQGVCGYVSDPELLCIGYTFTFLSLIMAHMRAFCVVVIEIVLAITHISAERFALLLDLITVLV